MSCRERKRRHVVINNDANVRFVTLCEGPLEAYEVVLYAYVMMMNHCHLFVQIKKEMWEITEK